MILVPDVKNKGLAVSKSDFRVAKKVGAFTKVSTPSWLLPKADESVSQVISSVIGNVVGISHAPALRVKVVVWSHGEPSEGPFLTTTVISSSLETVKSGNWYVFQSAFGIKFPLES